MSLITSCKPENNELEIEIGKSEEQDKKDIQLPNDKIAEKGLEMRGANLWIKLEDLSKLKLDGKTFILPKDITDIIEFSHVSIDYPLMIFNTNSVYDMEESQILFTIKDLSPALEKQWKRITEGTTPLKGGQKIHPDWFHYITRVKFSPSRGSVFFDLTHYSVAITDSVLGVIDLEDKTVNFLKGPITGEVVEMDWSHDENYIAYIMGEFFSWSLRIEDLNDFQNKFALDHKDLLKDEVKIKDMDDEIAEPYYEIIDFNIEWMENKVGVLSFKGVYIYPTPDKEIRFKKIIDLGI